MFLPAVHSNTSLHWPELASVYTGKKYLPSRWLAYIYKQRLKIATVLLPKERHKQASKIPKSLHFNLCQTQPLH